MDKSPDAFRTISEVADDLDLPQHVLRFWETRFTQIKPMKRGGGRRYYRPEDVDLLKGIRHLLYDHGYTIKGVQKLLKVNGNKFVAAIASGDLATVEALAAASHEEPPPPKAGSDEDQIVGRAK
ncbi:MerR family transcriptional regulator, partial [Shinella sp.]